MSEIRPRAGDGESESSAVDQVTHGTVWRLSAPIILSNLTIPLLGLVDTAVMGHLSSPEYLGAVGLGAMIFNFIYWGFGFLRMGTTGMVAQAMGAEDHSAIRRLLLQGGLLALVLALALLLLQQPIRLLAMALIDTTPDIAALTVSYFDIRIWSAPATLMNYVILGWLIGMQNTRAALLQMLTVNGVNIVLDLILVPGLGMTVDGVAWASVAAEWSGVGVGLLLVSRLLEPGHWPWSAVLERRSLTRLLAVNQDIMLRTLGLIFAFAFFTRQSAALGPLVLAANTVLLNFQHIMAYGLDGFAHAAEALIGRWYGARRSDVLRRAFRLTGWWSAGTAVLFALGFLLLGPSLIQGLTDLERVRDTALAYLPWLIVSPLISVWCFWLDGVFIGATLTRAMRNTMLVSLVLVFLPVWWLSRDLGNHGLWLALLAFMAARALTMSWVLRRDRPLSADAAALADRSAAG